MCCFRIKTFSCLENVFRLAPKSSKPEKMPKLEQKTSEKPSDKPYVNQHNFALLVNVVSVIRIPANQLQHQKRPKIPRKRMLNLNYLHWLLLFRWFSGQKSVPTTEEKTNPETFTTIVTVVKATDIKKGDTFSQSDGFCIVRVGQLQEQTRVIPSSKNPAWNQRVCDKLHFLCQYWCCSSSLKRKKHQSLLNLN